MLSSPPSSDSGPGSKKMKPDPGTKRVQNKWKTPGQQRIYNRRLLDALRNPQPASTARAIKEAADSALALTAHGQSRWSRAILSSRLIPRRRVLLKAAASKCRRPPKPNKKQLPPPPPKDEPTKDGKVNDRLRALGRLVPGCRKLAVPCLLEEAADYVAALELQVRTMRALADAMSAAALSSPPPPPTESEPA